MPCRSRRIASTRSSRSAISLVCWPSTSLSSCSANRLTEPRRSRSRRMRSSLPSTSAISGSCSSGFSSATSAAAAGSTSSNSRISCSMSASRRAAPSRRSSARAASVRASPTASSAARAALSAAASAVSPSARRSAAARRPAVAVSISPISAWRWAANFSGAWSSSARSVVACFGALADGFDLCGGLVLALAPFGAFADDRLQATVGELGIARDRLRFDAHLGERRAVLCDVLVDLRESRLELGRRRQRIERVLRFRARRRLPRRGRRRCAAAPLAAPRRARRCGRSRARRRRDFRARHRRVAAPRASVRAP